MAPLTTRSRLNLRYSAFGVSFIIYLFVAFEKSRSVVVAVVAAVAAVAAVAVGILRNSQNAFTNRPPYSPNVDSKRYNQNKAKKSAILLFLGSIR